MQKPRVNTWHVHLQRAYVQPPVDTTAAAAAAQIAIDCGAVANPIGDAAKPKYVHMAQFREEAVVDLVNSLVAHVGDADMHRVVNGCARDFEMQHPEFQGDAHALMRTTLNRLAERGKVEDLPKRGRRLTASDARVGAFLDAFLAGNGEPEERYIGYTSIQDAVKRSDVCALRAAQTGLSYAQLWRRTKRLHMQRYGVPMKKISLYYKPKLTQEVKDERLKCAREWLEQDTKDQFLDYVVWIDEKTEWLTPRGTYRCYAPVGFRSRMVESDMPLGKKLKVKYQAAASALMGGAWFGFVAGTTGQLPRNKVRTVEEW